jgi:RNA polymerase sigma-70 factor (ECF subfamily)
MTHLMKNKSLLDEYRAGEPKAVHKVYRLYADNVFRLVALGFYYRSRGQLRRFKGLGLGSKCEDCVQDIFEKAFSVKARVGYDGRRPFENYLLGIVRNQVINWLRHQKVVERIECESFLEDQALLVDDSSVLETEERILSEQIQAQVSSFHEGLGQVERGIFEVRLIEAVSVEECARRLNVSAYRVKRSEKELRRRLLVRLKRQGLLSWVPLTRVFLQMMVFSFIFV